MGLGHRHLILSTRKKLSKTESERSANLIHRVIQVGLLLLGIGTVLGGVWANESWGRFWGWDPKETWALITFLGYLIVVHLRFSKKMSDWWLAMSSVLGFLLVLMTWYGVNFVLGRGLHSYGQGAGGMEWMILFLILEGAFVLWAFLKHTPPVKSVKAKS
jgi:cytochrome c biogenesis factor